MDVIVDDLDWRIIALLQDNGRMSTREIAVRVGRVSDRAIRYRIERLVKSGAISIGAVVSAQAIGYTRISDVLITTLPDKLHDNALRIARHERVAYVGAGFGDGELGNISVHVTARTDRELRETVRETVGSLDGIVRVQGLIVPDLVKDAKDWRPASAS
jgi:Lrp/AsnC family transcriptional regulator for asnA, asnC and gidA